MTKIKWFSDKDMLELQTSKEVNKMGNDCNSGIGITNFELQPEFCNGNKEEAIRKKQKRSKKSTKVNF